jgi:glycerol kinase
MTVTPESQALEVRWPGGGFVWNHPAAVIVERNGEIEYAPIRDETRAAQVAALTIAALAGTIAVWAWRAGR